MWYVDNTQTISFGLGLFVAVLYFNAPAWLIESVAT
jgi:hypothetical protein